MRNPDDIKHTRQSEEGASARERLLKLLLAAEQKRRQTIRYITPVERWDGPIPASYAQERLWFLDQLGLIQGAYNFTLAMQLSGKLSEEALERSLRELVRRHGSLRTRFGVIDGTPHQIVDPPDRFELQRADLSQCIEAQDRERQLQVCMHREKTYRFDLSEGPLLRVVLVKLSYAEHALLITMHHIVTDGWSSSILLQELSTLYAANLHRQPDPLPPPQLQYTDYAIWQRQRLQGNLLQEHLQYWRKQLQGAPPQLELPTDRPRPAVESFKGAALRFDLPASVLRKLQELSTGEGATLFMTCLAAYQILLARWSGQDDIVVGSPVAGREHRELEGLVGFFVNTLALRTELSPELTFRQLLHRVKETTLGAYAHQELPFEALVADLRPDRNLARQPIFQTILVLQNFPRERLELTGVTSSSLEYQWNTTHFDLGLFLYEADDRFGAAFEYATDLFDTETIARLARHYAHLLERVVSAPDLPIGRLWLLNEDEMQQLAQWNATAIAPRRECCVHELFEEQAQQTPDTSAVIVGHTSITYAEINLRANRLARHLLSQCAGPGHLVGICVERSLEMVIGLLGILKAGAAYVPLDPNYPQERLQYMLQDAAPAVVLTQDKLRTLLTTRAHLIPLDSPSTDFDELPPGNLPTADLGLTPSSLVYVIYTSGSTGRPKGTAMAHGSMANLIEWHRHTLPAGGGRRVLQFAALSFDVAFQEIFSTLCTGGTLILLDEWIRKDAQALTRLLNYQQVQRLFVPPLMLQSIAEHSTATGEAPNSLQDVITAGEQLRISPEISRLFKHIHGCRLHNHYGPTETHVVTALTLPDNPEEWPALPSIGRPVWNTHIHILDRERQPVPIGVAGEIYIGGICVARDYLGRPELTATRFLKDPFSSTPGGRLYRTGDAARWRADGTIEYLGRNDDQVKIRGYRIELGEIEARLLQHPDVREAVVVTHEDSLRQKYLIAYVTSPEQGPPKIEDLREHLKSSLPEYMVPSAFVMLERLPLTPNGKLDRRALPAPDPQAYASHRYEPPHGEVEEALAAIWQTLLRVERVGRHDNFFELGGHSLHAMRLIAKVVDKLGVTLSAISVFQHPTLSEMAGAIRALQNVKGNPSGREHSSVDKPSASFTLVPNSESEIIPLSFSQRAHWSWYRLDERPAIRHLAAVMRLQGALNIAAFHRALAALVRRHDALRIRIRFVDGAPAQQVLEADDFEFRIDDLTTYPEDRRDSQIKQLIDTHIFTPIDVRADSLMGVRLLRLSDTEHVLIIALEHMICDAYSLSLLLRETRIAYEQATRGESFTFPPVAVSFSEHVVSQHAAMESWLQQHGPYWKEHLLGQGRLRVPDDPLPHDPTRRGYATLPVRIDRVLKRELQEWCRRRQTTLVLSALTAFAALVFRWCNVSDGVIQYQSSGRHAPEVENTVGYFASMLYLRIQIPAGDNLLELLTRVTKEYVEAFEHRDGNYWASQVPRPEFTHNSGFNWLPLESSAAIDSAPAGQGGLTWSPIEFPHPMLKTLEVDLEPSILLRETDEEVVGELMFSCKRFSSLTMERFVRDFTTVLTTLLRAPQTRVRDIPLS